jgi:hypothetical protein
MNGIDLDVGNCNGFKCFCMVKVCQCQCVWDISCALTIDYTKESVMNIKWGRWQRIWHVNSYKMTYTWHSSDSWGFDVVILGVCKGLMLASTLTRCDQQLFHFMLFWITTLGVWHSIHFEFEEGFDCRVVTVVNDLKENKYHAILGTRVSTLFHIRLFFD